jgi:vitamin B12 transporter
MQFTVHSLQFSGKGRKIIIPAILLLIFSTRLLAVMEIVVEAGKEDTIYDCIYGADEISLAKPQGLSDIISSAPGLNIVSRSFPMLQGDVNINGGSFEQAAIIVDGVKVNDVQTGHYNLDLPFTMLDLSEVSVLRNGNTIAGAGGLSGLVDIKTKEHDRDAASAAAEYGSYDTLYSAISTAKRLDDIVTTASVEKSSSRGYHKATDYDMTTAFLKTEFLGAGYNAVSFGYAEKNYGAFDFYTPGMGMPSREYTETKFLNAVSKPFNFLEAGAYIRPHFDHFILNEDNPSYYENRHNSSDYGGDVKYKYEINDDNSVSIKYSLDREEIQSSNLGNHYRDRQEGLINGFFSFEGLDINVNAGIEKYDVYSNYDFLPSIAASYSIIDSFKMTAAYSYAMRYPDFTELYYSDPFNSGNVGLKPEKSHEYSLNGEYNILSAVLKVGLFYKNSFDLIDWGKNAPLDPKWQIQNIGGVNAAGFDMGIKYKTGLVDLNADYSYLDSYISQSYISKYGLAYLRNKFCAGLALSVFETRFAASYIFKNYANRQACLNNFDVSVSRKVLDWLEITIKADNVFDHYFEEIPGIPAPGRMIWVRADFNL